MEVVETKPTGETVAPDSLEAKQARYTEIVEAGRFRWSLVVVACRRMGDQLDGEDIAQSTLLLAWENLNLLRQVGAMHGWIWRIFDARMASRMRARAFARKRGLNVADWNEIETKPAVFMAKILSPHQEYEAGERTRIVQEILPALSDQEREVIGLTLKDLHPQEIFRGHLTELTPTQFRLSKNRATVKMRKMVIEREKKRTFQAAA